LLVQLPALSAAPPSRTPVAHGPRLTRGGPPRRRSRGRPVRPRPPGSRARCVPTPSRSRRSGRAAAPRTTRRGRAPRCTPAGTAARRGGAPDQSAARSVASRLVAGDAAEVRLTALVRGRVQGVGFRWWAGSVARQLGLRGWAVNLDDGRV